MLRMTKTADYGIVLLTHMAGEADRIFNAPELAQGASLPHPTVSKVLKILAREGILASHRGAKGGYSLARTPQEISVDQIIEALDGPIGITECIDEAPGECDQEPICPVRGNWQRINEAIRDALSGITLAEMTSAAPERLVQLGHGVEIVGPIEDSLAHAG